MRLLPGEQDAEMVLSLSYLSCKPGVGSPGVLARALPASGLDSVGRSQALCPQLLVGKAGLG